MPIRTTTRTIRRGPVKVTVKVTTTTTTRRIPIVRTTGR